MKRILIFSISLLIMFIVSCKKEPTELNSYPPVLSNLSANPSALNPGESTLITAEASDSNGDKLTFSWETNHGEPLIQESSESTTFTWTSPDTPGTYFINCTVSDGEGSKSGYILIPVGDTIRVNVYVMTVNPLPEGSKVILLARVKKNVNFTNDENFTWSMTQSFEEVIDSNGTAEFRFINKSIPDIGGIVISKITFNDGSTDIYESPNEYTVLTGQTKATEYFINY